LSDIQSKREAIKKKYSNSMSWAAKVDQMPEKQVLAVYSRLTIELNAHNRRLKNLTRKGK
jgi:hypothetical protein